MPLLDFNDAAVWDSLYSVDRGDGTLWHFERHAKRAILGEDHQRLLDALGLQPGQRIALIGAGFGWVAEDWIAAGLTVVAVDTSPYIHARKAANAFVPILDADVLTPAGRLAIAGALGGPADWAISEDILPCLSDAECANFSIAMRQLAPNVCHWVSAGTPSGDPRLNWKTEAEWKALVAPDLIVRRGGREVL